MSFLLLPQITATSGAILPSKIRSKGAIKVQYKSERGNDEKIGKEKRNKKESARALF